MMTQQEIFDKVVAHLRSQKVAAMKVSSGGGSQCRYRGDNGTSCAIGCLIPDDQYKTAFESTTVEQLFKMPIFPEQLREQLGVTWVGGYLGGNINFLRALQAVHDAWDPSFWEQQLYNVAKDYQLTYTPLSDMEHL